MEKLRGLRILSGELRHDGYRPFRMSRTLRLVLTAPSVSFRCTYDRTVTWTCQALLRYLNNTPESFVPRDFYHNGDAVGRVATVISQYVGAEGPVEGAFGYWLYFAPEREAKDEEATAKRAIPDA